MMKYLNRLAVLGTAVAALTLTLAADPLPRSAPEAQGLSSSALVEFIDALDQLGGLHSVMILRRGHVVAEGWWTPYAPDHNHVLYSLSKSFTSTAVGFAVAEGKLSVDDEVVKFFPEEAPGEISANLAAMRVRDILTMATGHQDEPPISPDQISARSFLAQPVPHLPGTHFKYNTAATFMQSAIVQKVTGQTVLNYLRPRLFEPLGIKEPAWQTNFQGISLGGYGLRVRTEDIARFGQLYLQKGVWQDRPLLPAEWIAMASARQVSNGSNPQSDWNQGYGFQFWRCRHNAFRGDGAFGQYCVVMPDQEVVIAITSGLGDMQAALNVIWEKLLPVCQARPLEPAPGAAAALRQRLAALALPMAPGAGTADLAPKVLNQIYTFPSNDRKLESITLRSPDGGTGLTLAIRTAGQEISYPAGFRHWRKARADVDAGRLARFPDEPVAGTYGWTAADTVEVKVCAYETPFTLTYRLCFDGDKVSLDQEANVAFGSPKQPTLVGRRTAD